MKVTGHEIINRLKELKAERSLLNDTFPTTLMQFPSDLEEDGAVKPGVIVDRIAGLELGIVKLQHAQSRYGAMVNLVFEGEPMPLIRAVKLLGGIERVEKLWRSASQAKVGRRNMYDDSPKQRELSKGVFETQARVVPAEVALKKAQKAGRRTSTLRGLIAAGNARAVEAREIGLDPALMQDASQSE
jgi:hypothetical protein